VNQPDCKEQEGIVLQDVEVHHLHQDIYHRVRLGLQDFFKIEQNASF